MSRVHLHAIVSDMQCPAVREAGAVASRQPCLLTCSFPACLPCLHPSHRRRRPDPAAFPAAVLYCTFCSFMLGYHVHEKAILMVAVPLGVLAAAGLMPAGCAAAGDYLFLSTVGAYSLFPLLFEPQEYPIKVRPLLYRLAAANACLLACLLAMLACQVHSLGAACISDWLALTLSLPIAPPAGATAGHLQPHRLCLAAPAGLQQRQLG